MTLAFFCLLAVVVTLIGGLLPMGKLLSRAAMTRMLSLRGGILLAVAFTEVLPEAWRHGQVLAGWGALAAFGFLFAVSRFAMLDTCPEYLEDCRIHILSFAAIFALTTHSFIDGFNLSVSFAASATAGTAVGIALSLHKFADGFTLTTLFHQSGYSKKNSIILLVLVALATPIGGVLSAIGVSSLSPAITAFLMGFAAGFFIYIGANDILPGRHNRPDRATLAYSGLGILGMSALKFL